MWRSTLVMALIVVFSPACGGGGSDALQTTDGRADAKEISESLNKEGPEFALIDCKYRKTSDDVEGPRGADSKELARVCALIEAGAIQKGTMELEDLIARSQTSDPRDIEKPTPDWRPAAKAFRRAANDANGEDALAACKGFYVTDAALGTFAPKRSATPIAPTTTHDLDPNSRLYYICDYGIYYRRWSDASDAAQELLDGD